MDCAFTRYLQFLDIILLLSSKHHLFCECKPCTRSNANWSPMCICSSGLPADFTGFYQHANFAGLTVHLLSGSCTYCYHHPSPP